jgi:hypothetical protein
MLPDEPEVLEARRAWLDAQSALDGIGEGVSDDLRTLAWYGTDFHDERGAFCVVKAGGPLEELIGDRVRLHYGGENDDLTRSAIVYVFGSADIDSDLAVPRRAFAALELLAKDEIEVRVEVIG